MRKKCILCSSGKIEDKGPLNMDCSGYPKNTHLAKCKNCELYWVDPLPNEKELSKIYSGVYHYHPSSLKDKILSVYFSQQFGQDSKIIENFKDGGMVLDVGAGRGDMLARFSADKWEKWAYDPFLSAKETSVLRKKVGKHVNDYTTLSRYPKNKFDVVIIRNVIEHTSNFEKLVEDSYKILKKGGILFVRTPNIDSLDFKLFKNEWYEVRMGGHIVFFGKKSLARTFRNAGFKVKYNKAVLASFPLSMFRSIKMDIPQLVSIPISIVYSFLSIFMGEGGDLLAVAQK